MRITFLLPRYGWHASGGYSVVYTYAGMLAARGHEVTVVHPRRLPPGGWPAPRGVLPHMRRLAGRARDALMTPRVEWFAVDPRVRMHHVPSLAAAHVPDADATIATWWSTAEAALALPESKGTRFHLIQGYEVWHGAEERVHAAWRAPLHKIFIARWLRERALELGVPPGDTTLIPNAIDLSVFRVRRPIEDRPARVVMLYSERAFKNGPLALEILRRAKARVPAMRAVLFGFEAAPAQLPPWATYVRNASPARLASDVYNEAAVYLCASLSEGWHLPPAEAMACGCAVVSSDIGGVADYAVHGDTALLYPPGDADAGAEHIVHLLTDASARVAIAARGGERISQFSWERSTSQLESLLVDKSGTRARGSAAAR